LYSSSVPSSPLRGIFAPVTTPFAGDDLDLPAFRRNARHYATTPLAGLVVLGSNGEAASLDDAESDALIAAAREEYPREKWLIAGAGRESVRMTVAACRRAASLGADAVMVRTPSFFKTRITAESLKQYYTAVADQSPAPVVLYNITAFTGVNLLPETAAELSRHPNVIGLKDSGGDITVISDLVAECRPGFPVLAGATTMLYASLCVGGAGATVGPGAVAPEICAGVQEAYDRGDHAEAKRLQRLLVPIARLVGPKWSVAGLKVAVDAYGLTGGAPRLPLLPVPPDGVKAIHDAVAALTHAITSAGLRP
jgi:4-hydroxy-2-oxoglutarate aldolase